MKNISVSIVDMFAVSGETYFFHTMNEALAFIRAYAPTETEEVYINNEYFEG